MAACDAALNTCEILEHIITFLPPRQILRAERVSKTWKKLIDSSKNTTRARCLMPVEPPTQDRGASRPIYEAGADIRPHPALSLRRKLCYRRGKAQDEEPAFLKESGSKISGPRTLEAWRMSAQRPVGTHEYLTSPPVPFLRCTTGYFGKHGEIRVEHRILESEHGIRVCDLKPLEENILGSSPDPRTYEGLVCTTAVWFEEMDSQTKEEEACELVWWRSPTLDGLW